MFEKEVSFQSAVFEGAAYFGDAIFKGNATFINVVFNDFAHFGGSTFEHGAYFGDSVFEGYADFSGAVFEERLFVSAEYLASRSLKGEVNLSRATFLRPEKVEFHRVDLSKFRFLEADVREVHFTDVSWNKKKGRGRNQVLDEVSPPYPFLSRHQLELDHQLIAQLYRRLRANYEWNLRYSEAGDFYIGEMEMTRKAERNILKKLPLLFYKTISNYGESYYRPLCWMAAILLLFPLLFMFAGIQPATFDPGTASSEEISYKLDFSSLESVAPTWEEFGDYYTCFLYSMSVFSFIRDKKYTTINNWGHTLFVAESMLGPVTLAFFLLALRRRFKR